MDFQWMTHTVTSHLSLGWGYHVEENYIAYHLTTLLEQMRESADAPPLRAVVMGARIFRSTRKHLKVS